MLAIMNIHLKPFDKQQAEIIAPWFDDPETSKWLGGRDWIKNIFRLLSEPVGTEFRGAHRLACYAYVAYGGQSPIGFIDASVTDKYVEYGGESDGQPIYLSSEDKITCAISFAVNPTERQKGYGTAILHALIDQPELKNVKIFEAGVEPENTGSIRTLEATGFTSNYESDFEGMYYFFLRR